MPSAPNAECVKVSMTQRGIPRRKFTLPFWDFQTNTEHTSRWDLRLNLPETFGRLLNCGTLSVLFNGLFNRVDWCCLEIATPFPFERYIKAGLEGTSIAWYKPEPYRILIRVPFFRYREKILIGASIVAASSGPVLCKGALQAPRPSSTEKNPSLRLSVAEGRRAESI